MGKKAFTACMNAKPVSGLSRVCVLHLVRGMTLVLIAHVDNHDCLKLHENWSVFSIYIVDPRLWHAHVTTLHIFRR